MEENLKTESQQKRKRIGEESKPEEPVKKMFEQEKRVVGGLNLEGGSQMGKKSKCQDRTEWGWWWYCKELTSKV